MRTVNTLTYKYITLLYWYLNNYVLKIFELTTHYHLNEFLI